MLYLAALALATPAAAAPLNTALATGAMAGLEAGAGEAAPNVPYLREDGTAGAVSDYADRVVGLNFWTTWRAPCREEMPSLQALEDALGAEGVSVVTMAFGWHVPEAMRRFWIEAGVTTLPLHRDADGALARALGVRGLPHTVLLDREGRVAGQVLGAAHWAAPETLAVIRRLLEPDPVRQADDGGR